MTVLDSSPAPPPCPRNDSGIAKRQWYGAKRPGLTVMAHTADHLPRCVGACSFRISGRQETRPSE